MKTRAEVMDMIVGRYGSMEAAANVLKDTLERTSTPAPAVADIVSAFMDGLFSCAPWHKAYRYLVEEMELI